MEKKHKTSSKLKNLLRFFLGFPLTIVSFYFIGKVLFGHSDDVISHIHSINPLGFALGILLIVLFFLLRSLTWNNLLHEEGISVDPVHSMYLLSISEIRRYIPGSVLGFLSRVSNFKIYKVPTNTILKLIFYESIIFLLTSLLISIPAVIFLLERINFHLPLFLFFLILIVPLFASCVFAFKYGRRTGEIILKLYKYRTSFLLMASAWILFGLGNYLIASSIEYFNPDRIVALSSLFAFSWLAGYVIIIAPLGLGVREAVLTYGLSFLSPAGIAATIAIISRVTLVIIELIFLAGVTLFHKFIKIRHKVSYQSLILWGAIVAYISYFSYVCIEKYNNFFTGRFDLGNMDQTVWNTIHGRLFEITNPDGVQITTRLAFHADFILILLSPFYIIWEDPRMLLLIQTVVIGLGAYFVFQICKRLTKNETISLIFSLSYLLNPLVQKQNLFDFHGVTLATTFLLGAFYFSLGKKYIPMLSMLLLAALTKENVFLIVGLFGIYLWIKDKNLRWVILTVACMVSFYLLVSKFIPQARGGQHFAVEYFNDFGDSPLSITKNIFFQPLKTAGKILSTNNINYLGILLEPAAFMSLLAPVFLIFSFPDLLINLLSTNKNLTSINFHYAATIIPFIYISAIYGTESLLKRKLINSKVISLLLLLGTVYSTYQYGALPGSKHPSNEIYNNRLVDRARIDKFLSTLPQDLSIAASNNVGSHLSHRQKIYTVPNGLKEADIVALLLNDTYAQPSLSEQKKYASSLKNDSSYILLFETGDFIAFSKKSVSEKIPRLSF